MCWKLVLVLIKYKHKCLRDVDKRCTCIFHDPKHCANMGIYNRRWKQLNLRKHLKHGEKVWRFSLEWSICRFIAIVSFFLHFHVCRRDIQGQVNSSVQVKITKAFCETRFEGLRASYHSVETLLITIVLCQQFRMITFILRETVMTSDRFSSDLINGSLRSPAAWWVYGQGRRWHMWSPSSRDEF